MTNSSFIYRARATVAIAVNTFREAVRNKIFGALTVFAVAVLASSLVLGALSLHNEVRVASDIGIFASTVFSMILTVYVSINLLHTEIDRRTIHTILSKPVRRWQFLLGKYLGILALMAVIVGLLGAATAGLVVIQGGTVGPELAWAFTMIFFQLLIVAAISLLFASFSSPLLSGLLSVGIFVLGHLHHQLSMVREFFEASVLRETIGVLQWLLPELSSLNLSVEVVRSLPIPASYVGAAAWYTFSYTAVVLALAMFVFSRRDLI